MSERDVRVWLDGRHGQVEIDGHDWSSSISGFSVAASAGKPPEVTLCLVHPTLVLEGKAEVRIADTTRDLLVGLGWTMPGCCECAR